MLSRIRIPFTLLFLTVMVVANASAGTFGGALPETALSDWGISHFSIRQGEMLRLFSGTVLSHDLGMFLRQMVFAGAVIGAYEWTEGSLRALGMFLSIDILGTLFVLFAVLPVLILLHPTIDDGALAVYDVGMSAGGFGLIGALVAKLPYRWLFLLGICAGIGIKVRIDFDPIADSVHVFCLFLGFAFQRALVARSDKRDVAQL